jgi:predicted O-methyltransferase YrrM
MTQEQWTAVDNYFEGLLIPNDPVLDEALQAAQAAGLPAMQVAPNQGKLLSILAKSIQARRILEIGTLAAYSTIWLARALAPGGKLVTLEADPKHAEVARANLERAGLSQTVEVRLGPALQSLPQLAAEKTKPFDLVFIDADKLNNTAYFDWALELTHPGSLIIVDNVVRNGAVLDDQSTDPSVLGVRRLNQVLATESRVMVTAVQTVGSKGYDGFAIAVVL